MSIDLEQELKFMAQEYGLSEKQVANWWRSAVRQMWGNSPFKRKMEDEAKYKIVNDNPKSMKRYPLVDRINCVKCGGVFSPSNIQLDHIEGSNSCKDLSEAESFMKAILFTPKDNLQWLCADTSRIRNKKKYTVSIGCHSLKSQIELNPSLTEHEAWCIRELGRIKKYESVIDTIHSLNVNSIRIPKTKKGQEELLYKLLLESKNE